MNLNQLKYFDTLSYLLHYQRAAEQLGISQPALSRSITELENELEVSLFNKKGRGVELSEAGLAFAGHIRRAMREIEMGVADVRELTNPHNKRVHLSTTFGLSTAIVPGLCRGFQAAYPRDTISYDIRQASSSAILDNVRRGISEIGFSSFIQDNPDMTFEPIYKWHVALLAPTGHPLTRFESVTLEQIAEYPFISSLDRTLFLDNLFQSRNLYPKVSMRLESDYATAAMVAQGFGLTVLPYNEYLKVYGIELIPISDADAYRIYYLVYLSNRLLSGTAQDFRRFVHQQKSEHHWME